VEVEVLGLDPVPVADPPRQAGDRVEVEQDHQVGHDPAGGEPVDLGYRAHAEPSGTPLIGQGRVQVAVAQHHRTPLQGRADDLLDQLGPGGGEQQRLGPRMQLDLGVQDHRPDPLPRRRAARLARDHHLAAPALQRSPQQLELGRLAGALDPLEGDQAAGITHGGVRR
jgi:hypothetical protein